MSDADQTGREIVRLLGVTDAIETAQPEALAAELRALLDVHVQTLDAITDDAMRGGKTLQEMRVKRERAARKAKLGGEAGLATSIAAALLASEAVDEVYADDATLERQISLALVPFLAMLEESALARMRGAVPRTAPPPVPRRATLATEGFAFPLFDAPREDASLDPRGACRACGQIADTRFEGACYACFRAGTAPAAIDTEYGLVTIEDARRGRTGGVPRDAIQAGVAIAEEWDDGAETWARVACAVDDLVELTRTPKYSTWQGESWLFHCGRPMIFAGSVKDAPPATLAEMLDVATDDRIVERILDGKASGYAFRCQVCGRRRAHHDES